ncbi:cell division protein FtsL [Bartonella schoenbuchensis]|uniref:Cell division protein FtsL n=2 Tax=Bartonella schoenbuchensis TaxID=165694 RepID=E6Z050_BARSR|nr:hypothetical protein [Bartonella schoenbuchensis]AQX30955.1 hypothetical protein BscR1v2_010280 [Bartonella schoenbuchensis R1]CBI82488.1 conserved hypothetical protein [Bartonella schoenbuchensis R1]CDP80379.1 putative secreted (periplasmic) protein [Bartonella schoenbuchensis]
MTFFRTLDVVLVTVMICMAAITYKVKYDVQKQIGEAYRLEREITAEKNMVRLLHAEWAVMIEPSRMQKLAEHYQKELGLEIIQPRQIVELKDIPARLYDQIDELIKKNTFEEDKALLVKNHVSQNDNVIQKGVQ